MAVRTLAEAGRCRPDPRLVAAGEAQLRSGSQESFGGREPDTRAAADDDRFLPAQHVPLLVMRALDWRSLWAILAAFARAPNANAQFLERSALPGEEKHAELESMTPLSKIRE
jgi:hypothetical protein